MNELNDSKKNNGKKIDDAEDLDLVMHTYNTVTVQIQFGYSSNYAQTTGSLCFYSKDEATNINTDFANNNNFKSFKY